MVKSVKMALGKAPDVIWAAALFDARDGARRQNGARKRKPLVWHIHSEEAPRVSDEALKERHP